MTAMETKILKALKTHAERMAQYDADRKAQAEEYMEMASSQDSEFWKVDYERRAKWEISIQNHGYDFITGWKNVIAFAMYERPYHVWHSAVAGSKYKSGRGAYITTELDGAEIEIVDKVFAALIGRGYLKTSKSGKMATFKG